MSEKYTSNDVIEMAIQAKARGVDLYLTLARSGENYHVTQLFTELAKDEQKHKHHLEKWLEELKGDKREEAYPGEKALYLKALADTNVFNCDRAKKHMLEKTINEEDALQAGIMFEKDFMLFLHEIKQETAMNDKGVVAMLIEDEARHLREMSHLKEKIKKKQQD